MSETPGSANDSTSQRQQVLAFFGRKWPPRDAQTLYDWGQSELQELGKELCVRAVLASYEAGGYRSNESLYDRSARRAAERWVLIANEDTRKRAGRIASTQTATYSRSRLIANMAGSNRRWPSAVGYGLTWRNPADVSSEAFRATCDAIEREILAWARSESDPVAKRYAEEASDTD